MSRKKRGPQPTPRKREKREAKAIPPSSGFYEVKPHKNPSNADIKLSGDFPSRASARRHFVKTLGQGNYQWTQTPRP